MKRPLLCRWGFHRWGPNRLWPKSTPDHERWERLCTRCGAGLGLDESMPPETMRIIVQIGCEMLAKLAEFGIGDYVTADIINRGLVNYLREREALRKAAEMGA